MTPAGSENAFAYLRKLIYDNCAIVLEADKRYLLEARLTPMLTRERLTSFDELVARLHGSNAGPLRQRVLEAVTTHETSFFRDLHPFDLFRKTVVPRLLNERSGTKRINLWCGASSTGQEPYSIAFIIKECGLQLGGWTVDFTATDLSEEVLARARTGLFTQLEVNRGLPVPMLIKHFDKVGLEWQVKPDLRNMINFRKVNLMEAWPAMPEMDVVFMRNVLIYFDVATKKRIFDRLARIIRPGGYLFLGTVESTHSLTEQFQPIQVGKAICYQRIS
ncbi:MAG TPA: protein-glutamate O-methyltransferase CheR [Polyangia bacterium]|jgi:chemotaxis protein methyltransferase CheR|nr:protein-glutamate O-methyltransferase CheR [Polyangia bacterium]